VSRRKFVKVIGLTAVGIASASIIPPLLIACSKDDLNEDTVSSNGPDTSAPVGKFFDQNGITWKVVGRDSKGNLLIMTKYVYGYSNSAATYTAAGTTTFTPYENSQAREWLEQWYIENCANLTDYALLPTTWNIESNAIVPITSWDKGWEVANCISEGGVKAGAQTKDVILVLSISDINYYFNVNAPKGSNIDDTYRIDPANGQPTVLPSNWWLRSPGWDASCPNACIRNGGFIFGSSTNSTSMGYRPAIWVNFGSYTPTYY